MGHRSLRVAAAVAAAAGALALAAVAAAAPDPSPYDGGPSVLPLSVPALPTPPFPLGTDLSDVGVSQSDLAGDGPNVQMAGSNYGHGSGDSGGSGGSASLLVVDDDRVECPYAQFTSIQDAVNAASPGSFIEVCRGDYQPFTVPAGKDHLTIFGTGFLDAFVQAPTTPEVGGTQDLVHVSGAKDVALINLVLTGPFPVTSCAGQFDGLRVDGGGSAIVLGDHITHIRAADDTLLGCQAGLGVLVGRASQAQVGSATIGYSLIDDYEKGGIVVDNTGSSAAIDHTIVEGIGSTTTTAQNGIQISRGATGSVSYTEVSGNVYADPTVASSAAILLYQSGKVSVSSSDTFQNDDGIDLIGVAGSSISNNYSHDQDDVGLYADADSAGNTFAKNVAHKNAVLDCEDDSVGGGGGGVAIATSGSGSGTGTAGTANTWVKDVGDTASPPGICHHS